MAKAEAFYACLFILTELMMLAMTLHVVNYSGFTREQKAWFLLTFAAIFLCSGAEYAVHCGYYDPKYSLLLTIITVLQFSVAPILGVLFTGALGLHQPKITIGFFVFNLIIEASAAPFGLIFCFGDEGYRRGDFFMVYMITYIFSLVYLLINMIIVAKRFRHRDKMTIVMILVILAAGIAPMTLYKVNVTYIAVAIAAILCYVFYNDLVQQDIQAELVANQKKISSMQSHMISGLASLVENRDMDTGDHISRTSAYVKTLAEDARADGVYTDELTDHFISLIYTLAPLHDIGKIIIPDSILKKPGKLTPEEFEQMKMHATFGGAVAKEALSGITDEEYLSFASDIAKYHHERWDGTGYPEHLKGEEVPLAARIMAIADVYDALVSKRCYKNAMTPEEAFKIIQDETGSHFDPLLAKVFMDHREDFEAALRQKDRDTHDNN